MLYISDSDGVKHSLPVIDHFKLACEQNGLDCNNTEFGYVAIYTNSPELGAYKIEQGIYVAGVITAPGYYNDLGEFVLTTPDVVYHLGHGYADDPMMVDICSQYMNILIDKESTVHKDNMSRLALTRMKNAKIWIGGDVTLN